MTVDEAVKIVAAFEGWKWEVRLSYKEMPAWYRGPATREHLPPYATDRDAIIAAALKLPPYWLDKFAEAVWWKTSIGPHLKAKLITAPAETLLVALGEVIQEMKGKE